MLNEIYDEVLQKLLDNHGINSETPGYEFLQTLSGKPTLPMLNYLEEKGYIKRHLIPSPNEVTGIPYWYISLTAEGAKFMADGGFQGEAFYRDEPLRLSRQANEISNESLKVSKRSLKRATIAIIVSVVAIFVGIIIFLIQQYAKP